MFLGMAEGGVASGTDVLAAGRAVLGTGVKVAVANLFERSGALSLLARTRLRLGAPRVHILAFHRVVDDLRALGPEVIPSLCITTASFERLLDLARARYDVLPLEAAAAVLEGRQTARRDVLAITFDDGYRDVYLRALPALVRRGLSATVFVPTGHIGSDKPLLHDRLYALLVRAGARGRKLHVNRSPRLLRRLLERVETLLGREGPTKTLDRLIEALPTESLVRLADSLAERFGEPSTPDEGARVMSKDELRACVDGGIDLGAHTIDHMVLVDEPEARVRHQLEAPRRELEEIAGKPCRTFAYCNGLWTPTLLPALRASGYTVAVTTRDGESGPGAEPLLLSRKVLWEGHLRGLGGGFSSALAAAQLANLFGSLGLVRPVDGARPGRGDTTQWSYSA